MSTTRRRFLGTAAAGAGALLLGGCGEASPPTAGSARPAGRFPARVRHRFGETVVPRSPGRVAVVGYTETDAVLALGVRPVLIRSNVPELPGGVGPWSRRALGDARPVVLREDLALERVAGQRPDLILAGTDEITREDYGKLSRIAPTVAPPAGHPKFGVPWEISTRTVGAALGRPADGEALVRRAQRSLARARRAIAAPAGSTAAVVATAPGGLFYVFSDTDVRGNLLRELGLRQPPAVARVAGEDFYAELSEERLDLLEDVDVLVTITYAEGSAETLRDSRAWNALPAVREGRVAAIEGVADAIAFSSSTAVSIPFAMRSAAPALRRAFAA